MCKCQAFLKFLLWFLKIFSHINDVIDDCHAWYKSVVNLIKFHWYTRFNHRLIINQSPQPPTTQITSLKLLKWSSNQKECDQGSGSDHGDHWCVILESVKWQAMPVSFHLSFVQVYQSVIQHLTRKYLQVELSKSTCVTSKRTDWTVRRKWMLQCHPSIWRSILLRLCS